ncbi:MAG: ABC transporter permease [Candidatus Aminicenantes bacterium]|nr:ABC transporter permease [Candidatus Aminicenantes bacterium]
MKNKTKNAVNFQIPKIARFILKALIPAHDFKYTIGVYEQSYLDIKRQKGKLSAYLWLFLQLCVAFPVLLKMNWAGGTAMIKSYIKAILRTIKRKKIYSLVNILGLSLGFACCILIYVYIAHELSFDRFHENGDSLFRLIRINHNPDGSLLNRHHQFPMPLGPELEAYFPEIEYFTRYKGGEGIVGYKDAMFEEYIDMADPHFFDIFTFPFVSGDPRTAITNDHSIVLTKNYAHKYFGKEDPIGKTITVTFGQNRKDYVVTGVVKDIPQNSTIRFNILMNISNYAIYWPYGGGNPLTFWSNFNAHYYLLLKPSSSKISIERNFPSFYDQYFSWYSQRINWDGKGNPFSFALQKMREIHFDPGLHGGTNPAVYNILMGITLIILVIACFNFINLTTGMSTVRSTEIGIRKVLGAGKKQLILQSWSESIIFSYISMGAGILLASLTFSRFNEFIGKQIAFKDCVNILTVIVLFVLPLTAGILSGIFPGLVMTNFNTLDTLNGKLKLSGKRIFTKSLIILQFSLSVFLIISAILMGNQIRYMINKDLGFAKDGLLVINILENEQKDKDRIVKLFRNKSIQHAGVLGLSVSTTNFGDFSAYSSIEKENKRIVFLDNTIDFDFMGTLGLKIVQGRDFSKEYSSDRDGVIVNQTFVEKLGYESPLGKMIGESSQGFPYDLRIIGVVGDFNFASLHNEIDPAIFHIQPGNWGYRYLLARISTSNIPDTLKHLEGSWKEIQPEKPFVYNFLSEVLENHYKTEKRWEGIIQISSLLAIGIACMGIFGLTSITINQRVKEIGIRKVLGAKFIQIVKLVAKDFVFLVGAANVIAWPIAYYVVNRWLQNFAYRIDIEIWIFILCGVLSLLIALLTVSYQSIKAATTNPVDSLRNE